MPRVHFANGSPTRVPAMNGMEDEFKPLEHDMLRISPNDFISFPRSGDVIESNIEIASTSKFPVTYKIQTTSPEKFRVRPRCGVLNPSESVNVNILLKQEHHLSDNSKDKFLVMAQPIYVSQGADISSQMQEVWKQKPSNSPDVEQHRLTCVYKGNGDATKTSAGFSGPNASNSKETDLDKHAKQLEKQVRNTQILQCVTLAFLLLLSGAVVYLLKLQIGPGSSDEESGYSCNGGKI